MAKLRIRRKKSELVNSGARRPESRLKGTRLEGSRVGPANDRFEREADLVANRVVAGAPRDPMFDARPDPDAIRTPQIGESGPASGTRLPPDELSYFQRKMGFNFANVRINADTRADTLARSVNAKAFARGNEIFFAQGRYSPGSTEGRRLLAHELTHVVQQSGGTSTIASVGAKDTTRTGAGATGEISAKTEAGAISTGVLQRTGDIPEKTEEPDVTTQKDFKCEEWYRPIVLVGDVLLGHIENSEFKPAGKMQRHGKLTEMGTRVFKLTPGARLVLQGASGATYRFSKPGLYRCVGKLEGRNDAIKNTLEGKAKTPAPTASSPLA